MCVLSAAIPSERAAFRAHAQAHAWNRCGNSKAFKVIDHEIALLRFSLCALADLVVMNAACCVREDSKTQRQIKLEEFGTRTRENIFTCSKKFTFHVIGSKSIDIKLQMR